MALRPALPLLVCLFAAACLAPGPAAAACRLQGQGEWGPIWTYTGPDDCGGALFPGTRFVVEGDVVVVADLVQSIIDGADITVAPGGSLRVAVGSGPRRIVLGDGGLRCQGGSLCDFAGGFRAPRDGTGVVAGQVTPEFTSESHWAFGAPIPCPGWDASEGIWQPDCGGDLDDAGDLPGANTVLGGHHEAPLDPELATALDAIQPGEVWYFLDPDPATVDAPRESGFHYDVAAAQGADLPGGPAGGWLHLDVRQGTLDNGYAQSRRTVLACEIVEPVAARTRTVYTGDGCIDADFQRDGHWLRFERNGVAFAACPGTAAAPCEAESAAWRIQRSEDDVACPGGGTCDRFTLADARGLDAARAAGGVVWINQVGAGDGDAGILMVPVRIGSATAAVDDDSEADSEIKLEGETHVRATAFDQVGSIWLGGNVFSFGRFEDVFVREPTADGQTPLLFLNAGPAVTLRRVTLIGGEGFGEEGTGGGGDDHGLSFIDPLRRLHATLEDVSVRYTWDDFIVTSGQYPPLSITARRVRTQFEGHTIQSQSGLQLQSPATAAYIEDFECIDCADNERPISLIGWPVGSVRRVLFLSPKSDVAVTVNGPVEDLTAIGARDVIGVQLSSGTLDRCVLRENHSTIPASLVSGSVVDLRQCLIRDNSVQLDLIRVSAGENTLAIRDSVVLDNTDTAGGLDDLVDCRSITGPGGSCVVERSTFGYSIARQNDPRNFNIGLTSVAGSDGRTVTIQNDAFLGLSLGFWPNTPTEATLLRVCFDRNATDALPAHMAHVLSPLHGGLELNDEGTGAFDPTPGGAANRHPCGIQRNAPPGVCQRLWVHAVNGLEPECMTTACSNGADDDFDGLRDFPEDPGCASPSDDAEGPECGDGLDNDGDGLVDLDDPGCPDLDAGPEDPACDDGVDNDADGLVDAADPQCTPLAVHRENKPGCGLGPELAPMLALLAARRRRRARRGLGGA